jgi:hypothetical protein
MFNRFRSMPATALAAVLGCALMTTATPAAAQKKEKPKKEPKARRAPLRPTTNISSDFTSSSSVS